jgi:hypothetical protein
VGLRIDGEVGPEADEVSDQMWVAADDAELATKLLLRIGHVTPTPPPPGAGGWRISRGES